MKKHNFTKITKQNFKNYKLKYTGLLVGESTTKTVLFWYLHEAKKRQGIYLKIYNYNEKFFNK